MDLRRSRPRASSEPDAGEAETDKEENHGDGKSPICGAGNGSVLLGDALLTANLGKTGRAGRAEATAARVAGCGGRSSGMKVAIHLAFLRIVPSLLIRAGPGIEVQDSCAAGNWSWVPFLIQTEVISGLWVWKRKTVPLRGRQVPCRPRSKLCRSK
jgi:hypothetical protein